jgi:antitoxin (DNA-binding transcriptional repressor) of toxin-antitoxin stability system
MKPVQIGEAQASLSRLIARACAGEDVVIARGDTPVVRLVPLVPAKRRRRKPGAWRGKLVVGPDFFAPLSDEELAVWER